MNAERELMNDNNTTYRGTLLVVDGHSLAFRAFYALPAESFSTSSGQPTNAVWGFATMLAQVIDAEKPDHLAVAFDVKGGTFRNDLLPQYKGTREAAPEELLSQLPLIQQMLVALGVTYIEKPGYEGDDVIGTLATMGEKAGYRTLVLSGDRDSFQLVNQNVTVLYPGHHFKDLKHMTPEAVEEKYRVTPAQYPDLAALRGETADNIPGVPGVGDGYAAKWINQFGSLEQVLDHADEITGKKGEALRDNIEQVRLNRKVNALVRDIDLGISVDDLTFGSLDADKVNALFTQLEFGARTKGRVLKTFNGGLKPQLKDADSDDGSTEKAEITIPAVTCISDVDGFDTWTTTHLLVNTVGDVSGNEVSHSAADSTVSSNAVSNNTVSGDIFSGNSTSNNTTSDITSLNSEEKAPAIDHNRASAPDVARSWVLYAEGTPKPGNPTLSVLALMINDQAAVLTPPFTDELICRVQNVVDKHSSTMVVHGYKEHLHLLKTAGVQLPTPLFDTKLAGYLVHPDFHADTLEQAAAHFLDFHIDEEQEATQGQLDFDDMPDDRQEESNLTAIHVAIIRSLAHTLSSMIDQRKQFGLLHALELPVSRILYSMEHIGAQVDVQRLEDMRSQFAADAEQAQQIAWEHAGTHVNLQSPKQLQKVLFEDMGLKPTRRTKSGAYTTSASALQSLYVKSVNNERANGFLGALLRHRETNKLKQIVQTLIDATNADDNRIHTTYEQTVAATGRLSSVDPNLQNIPNRNAAGREIRSAFIPGDGYESLLSADYSQVELRIMAHLSGDEALIEAFQSGTDFHRYVASLVYGIPVDEISADQRSHVKAMSYGLAYGLSTYGLAQQLKISPAAADVLKDQYFATFGKVHDYLESLVSDARVKGYTETMFGRRRYFPALSSLNRTAREAAERAALNAPIQGTAADIMKIAMIRAEQALHDAGVASRITMQIHDELVVEIAPGEAEQVTALVKDAMEHAVKLAVPLDVSTGIGSDWQQAIH